MFGRIFPRRILALSCFQISPFSTTARSSLNGERKSNSFLISDTLGRNNFENGFLKTTQLGLMQMQLRNYAARKGTRERREKLKRKRKKEKVEVVKLTFYQKLKLRKEEGTVYRIQKPEDRLDLGDPVDDVFFFKKYAVHQWPFAEAVQNLREAHHPSVLNKQNCPLLLRIHLNFQFPHRPNKNQEGWKSVVPMKQPFLLPGMVQPKVLAFCANEPGAIEEALEAGADTAGGSDLIKSLQTGMISVNDYEYVVAHPLLLTELTTIRGLIKRKFPNVRAKTLDTDIPSLVKHFKAGMKIQGRRTDNEPGYGWVEEPVGTLDMDIDGMEGNFEAILADTLTHRLPQRTAETFVFSCVLKTEFCIEQFKLNATPYILKLDKRPATKEGEAEEAQEESETEGIRVEKSSA